VLYIGVRHALRLVLDFKGRYDKQAAASMYIQTYNTTYIKSTKVYESNLDCQMSLYFTSSKFKTCSSCFFFNHFVMLLTWKWSRKQPPIEKKIKITYASFSSALPHGKNIRITVFCRAFDLKQCWRTPEHSYRNQIHYTPFHYLSSFQRRSVISA
jgi:hypothetical protein